MRNLKRVLTLVMAVAMMMSLLVVGAGATFSDQDKIENTDAVNMNVALGIIKGRDTGDFDPTGNVTRAEMAKMICVALNGGKEPTLGTKATATYKDTKGHWAEAYIEYCTSLGIVAGMGDGTFAPNANVTGTQAAKMLLVCLGYDADKESFNGSKWSININVRASQKDLYDDLAIDPNAALNRDDAAQMVYNALNATKVEYEYKLTTVNGALTTVSIVKDVTTVGKTTILEDKFDVKTKYTYLVGMSYDSKKAEYTYTYDSAGGTLPYAIAAADQLTGITLKSKVDYSSLMGQMVKVIYKNNTDKDVYGIFADSDSKVLATGAIGDIGTIKTDSFKFAGTVYKVDAATTAGTQIYSFVNTTANWAGLTVLGNVGTIPAAIEPFNMKIVDADNDGKVDYLVAVPFTVAKVTYVGTTSITAGNVSYKFEDCNISSDLKKDDYAIITADVNTAKEEATLVKADVVTGDIKGIESATKITLDGTTYIADAGYTPPTFGMNDTFKLVVVNGYFFNASKQSSAATKTNVALAIAQNGSMNTMSSTLDVKLLLADGTKKVVEVKKVNIAAGGALAQVIVNDADNVLEAGEVFTGQVYTYEVNSDGYYELSRVVNSDYDAYATSTVSAAAVAKGTAVTSIVDGKAVVTVTGASNEAGNAGSYYFNDDAVVFYYNGSEYKVASGANVNKWADIGAITGIFYANKTNGFNKTEIAFLNVNAAPDAGDTTYGWVTGNPVLVKDGDDYYLQFKVWNGTSEVTLKADDYSNTNTGAFAGAFTAVSSATNASSLTNLAKGCPVSYIDNGDGYITNIQGFKAAKNAVIAYADGGEDVAFMTTPTGAAQATVTIESDTKMIYVDTANNAGVNGGSITIADEPLSNNYVYNCYVLANASNEIKAIIVDTSNKLDTNPYTMTVGAQAGAATAAVSEIATYAVTYNEVASTTTPTITWYTDNTYATTTTAPTNITATASALSNGASTVTLTEGATAVATGTYYFTVTVGNYVVQCTFITL